MSMLRILMLIGCLLVLTPAALACGYCDEDKIASVYDHTMIVSATEKGQQVVFCSTTGGEEAKFRAVLQSVGQIAAQSIRFSADNQALAFAYDPAQATVEAQLQSLNAELKKSGAQLQLLRVMKKPGQFEGGQGL